MEVNRHASANTIKLLIGNKADLVSQKAVTEQDAQVVNVYVCHASLVLNCAQAFADKLNISFLETSAKNSTNVEAAFLTMAKELIKARYIYLVHEVFFPF